jgi:prohibitin 1
MDDTSSLKVFGTIGAVVVILLIVLIMFPVVVIGAGERGVVFNNTSGIENRILGEGVHFRIPLVESVTSMSIKVQKTDVKADAASKDLQTVNTDIVVNWHLDSAKVNKIYQEIGDQQAITDKILIPAVSEVVKAATAQMTAEELLAKRPLLKSNIDEKLKSRLITYNVVLDDVSITNIQFSPEFNKAIEEKTVAQQNAQKAVFQAEQAKNDAVARVNKAQGEADAQKLVQQTLTPELLQKMAIEKWSGAFPTYFGGGVLPFLDITTK